ncbi:unnamed protein product [Prorocentrum cordatum]|uniref:Ankyrin repeat domain-containing protein n=1 Tax=Prorocentrum cordatum TaxID=2364126 RepID=A0ABN9PUF9_9DINO|nr:unnamed protein product [Polarella glacialis]
MRSTEAEPRRAEAVELLVAQGADPELKDAGGQSALDIAAGREGRFAPRVRAALAGSQGAGADRDLEAARGGKPGGASKRAGKDRAEAKISGPAIFWLVSVSLATVQYLTELRPAAWTIVPFFALYFELGVVASLALFVWVSRSDPGKVPPRPREEAIRAMAESAPACARPCAAAAVHIPTAP